MGTILTLVTVLRVVLTRFLGYPLIFWGTVHVLGFGMSTDGSLDGPCRWRKESQDHSVHHSTDNRIPLVQGTQIPHGLETLDEVSERDWGLSRDLKLVRG